MPNQSKKPYNSDLCHTDKFFVPHADANHLNAQDVINDLVTSAKNISFATWNCFEDGETLVVNDGVVADLIHEIRTKLEMIERILPLAFDDKGDK